MRWRAPARSDRHASPTQSGAHCAGRPRIATGMMVTTTGPTVAQNAGTPGACNTPRAARGASLLATEEPGQATGPAQARSALRHDEVVLMETWTSGAAWVCGVSSTSDGSRKELQVVARAQRQRGP